MFLLSLHTACEFAATLKTHSRNRTQKTNASFRMSILLLVLDTRILCSDGWGTFFSYSLKGKILQSPPNHSLFFPQRNSLQASTFIILLNILGRQLQENVL